MSTMEWKPRRGQPDSDRNAAPGSKSFSAPRPRAAQSLREQYCAPAHGAHSEAVASNSSEHSLREQYGAHASRGIGAAGKNESFSRGRYAEPDAKRGPSVRASTHSARVQGGDAGEEAAPRPRKRRRRRDPGAIIFPILMILAALAGIVYTGSSWLISTVNEGTYCSNIYINGIDISRYSKEEGKEYVRQQIDERLNTSYTLSWQGATWSFTAAEFGGAIETDAIMDRAWNIGHVGNIFDRSADIRSLNRNPIYLNAPLVYDETGVDALVTQIYDQLYIAPQNATVAADLNSPYLASGSSEGQELDRETARAQIVSLLETGEGGTVLPVLTLEPALTTEQAESSLELIVEYKTDTTARGYNGRFNVRKALSYFFGMIVQPGEEVSFNEVVGPRTAERGWQLGTEYIGGGKTQEAYGGGVCQASTTLYGALLKAGMTILARSPHSMTVAYVEPSIDAAVTETSSKDLRFRNDTENPITIYTEVTKEYAMVQIYGVRPPYRYELESKIISEDTTAVRVAYIDDTTAEHCYFDDQIELYKKGRSGIESEGWLVAYDWDTGAEVERRQLSFDKYQSGTDIYWRGTHSRDEGAGAASANDGSNPAAGAVTAPPVTEAPTRAPDIAANFDT